MPTLRQLSGEDRMDDDEPSPTTRLRTAIQTAVDELDALCKMYDSIGAGHAAQPVRPIAMKLKEALK